jgi:hypothetical protein
VSRLTATVSLSHQVDSGAVRWSTTPSLSGGWPSIRSKALSSDSSPERCSSTAFVAAVGSVEDQEHWRTRVNHYPVKLTSFHQPSIRLRTSAMILLREPPVFPGGESAQSGHRSIRRGGRPGPPAGYSRCERSLDTVSGSAASSRVVPPVDARPLPWPRPSVCRVPQASLLCLPGSFDFPTSSTIELRSAFICANPRLLVVFETDNRQLTTFPIRESTRIFRK